MKDKTEQDVKVNKGSNILKETFGTHKFSKSTAEIMKEVDKELYDI